MIVAVRTPRAEGSKVTSNVVDPPAGTDSAGWSVTEKSPAFVPETSTDVRVSAPDPVFSMLNVRVTVPAGVATEPKSVWSAVPGVVSPSAMVTLLPVMLISGAGGAGQSASSALGSKVCVSRSAALGVYVAPCPMPLLN